MIVSENTTSDYPQIEEAFRNDLKAVSGLPDDPHIEITETYHIPGEYMVKDANMLENIVQDSREKTRSELHLLSSYILLPVPGYVMQSFVFVVARPSALITGC